MKIKSTKVPQHCMLITEYLLKPAAATAHTFCEPHTIASSWIFSVLQTWQTWVVL